jgi:hypothetical protein
MEPGDGPDETGPESVEVAKAGNVSGAESGGGNEPVHDAMRDSSEDLASMPPDSFFPEMERRVAADPDSPRTRRWMEEAKRRLRLYAGTKITSFAFDRRDGKLKIVLTVLGSSLTNGKLPPFLQNSVQNEGEQKEPKRPIVRAWMTMKKIVDEVKRQKEEQAAKNAAEEKIQQEISDVTAMMDRIIGHIKSGRQGEGEAELRVVKGDVSDGDKPADPDDKNEKK